MPTSSSSKTASSAERGSSPATDGRPDSRPDVRENAPVLGNLIRDFNFSQPPRRPLILNLCPPTTLIPAP